MESVTTIGLDLAKHVFQAHGAGCSGAVVFREKLRRGDVLSFFTKLPARTVAMEACGGAHYWGRELQKLGHQVRLIAPAYVKEANVSSPPPVRRMGGGYKGNPSVHGNGRPPQAHSEIFFLWRKIG